MRLVVGLRGTILPKKLCREVGARGSLLSLRPRLQTRLRRLKKVKRAPAPPQVPLCPRRKKLVLTHLGSPTYRQKNFRVSKYLPEMISAWLLVRSCAWRGAPWDLSGSLCRMHGIFGILAIRSSKRGGA